MGHVRNTARDLWRGRAPVLHVLTALLLGYGLILVLPGRGGGSAAAALAVAIPAVWIALIKVRRQLRDSAGLPAALLLILAAVVVLASGGIKAVGALVSDVPAIQPYVPPQPKTVVRGDAFLIEGEIDYRILSELEGLTVKHPAIRLVILNSEGGHAQAGRAIGLFIADKALDTRSEGRCFSACTLAFAGGAQRQLGPQGQLGFHGYRQDSHWRPVTLDIEEVEQKDQAFLTARGIAPDFLKRAYSTPPDQMWLPERAELLKSGVLTP